MAPPGARVCEGFTADVALVRLLAPEKKQNLIFLGGGAPSFGLIMIFTCGKDFLLVNHDVGLQRALGRETFPTYLTRKGLLAWEDFRMIS